MDRREDQLLVRWCEARDVEALGELFDCVAPRLLKLAIHLVGDAVEAEDLVQQTFLALIEQREAVDFERPAMPWLTGVLAHKAADHRRSRAREFDASRLHLAEGEDPGQPAERRELSGEVAKAIDALVEPYRRVILLRLRHGLAIGDIAHVLGRNPGTVRVQLHRAHEKLKQVLPGSLVGAISLELGVPSGLDAIKGLLLEEASLTSSGLTFTSFVGAWIVSHKIALACAGALVLAALSLWNSNGLEVQPELEGLPEQRNSRGLASESPRALSPAQKSPGEARVELATQVAQADGALLKGHVVDAATGDPLEGAKLELFLPRRLTMVEALRRNPELYKQSPAGPPTPRTMGDWPSLGTTSGPARFGRTPLELLDIPDEESQAIAVTSSGVDGSFSLPRSSGELLLVCHRAGYGRRCVVIRAAKETVSIRLFPERVITGRVRQTRGGPPGVALDLVFWSSEPASDQPAQAGLQSLVAYQGLGIWTTRCDVAGKFEVRVAGDALAVEVLTPGWQVPLSTALTGSDVEILVRRMPMLHFEDASSGEPIERVRLLGLERRNNYVKWAGEFHAPGGDLTLPGGPMWIDTLGTRLMEFHAWAEGYGETDFSISEVTSSGRTVVQLEAGEASAIAGMVRRGGSACANATVALLGHSPMQWLEDEDCLVDAIDVDASGNFELHAARGDYILRVQAEQDTYFEVVSLPYEGSWDVDLDHTASAEVVLVDAQVQPQARHFVGMRGSDGRSSFRTTDARGVAAFRGLAPGGYTFFISASPDSYPGAVGDEQIEFELDEGEQRSFELELEVLGRDRHARISAHGVADYSAWRARWSGEDWQAIAVDGTIPMDLSTAAHLLEITSPSGQRWCFPVPAQERDGYEIRLELEGLGYSGRLSDPAGKPCGGVRVFARPLGDSQSLEPTISAVSDAEGRFELLGLEERGYVLSFSSTPERMQLYDWESIYKDIQFLPAEPPSENSWLEISLNAQLPKLRVTGRVLRRGDHSPVQGVMVLVDCRLTGASGVFMLGVKENLTHTDGEGRFELLIPRTPSCTFSVFTPAPDHSVLLREVRDNFGLEQEPDVLLLVD